MPAATTILKFGGSWCTILGGNVHHRGGTWFRWMGLVRVDRRAGAEGAWYGFQREVGKACERGLGGEG